MIQDLLLKAQGDFPKFLSSVQKEGKQQTRHTWMLVNERNIVRLFIGSLSQRRVPGDSLQFRKQCLTEWQNGVIC